jgi:signal transduction histidine kinase
MEQELIEARNAAEAANRAKNEFLANLSHDVITPLASIDIVARSLLAKCDNDKDQQGIKLILSCQKQLRTFFKNCLENANYELASPELNEEIFSVKVLMEEFYELFLPQANEKQLSLEINIQDDIPHKTLGCRAVLFRVILNLISNAFKFTEFGGIMIKVSVSKTGTDNQVILFVSVQDTGIGIPDEKQALIFERLSRLAPAFSKKIEGSGIGLYIVDQYVKRLKGTIQVKSRVGEGSTFIVSVPLKIVAGSVRNFV